MKRKSKYDTTNAVVDSYKIHPAALLYPPMTLEEFEQLKSSILEIGIRETLLVGQFDPDDFYTPSEQGEWYVIDGRNRYLAACDLQQDGFVIALPISVWDGEGDLLDICNAKNATRRQLTKSQLACVGVRLMEEEKANNRPGRKAEGQEYGDSRDIAAQRLGVSGGYIAKAARLADIDPELWSSVWHGELSLYQAEKTIEERAGIVRQPPPEPRKAIPNLYGTPEDIQEARLAEGAQALKDRVSEQIAKGKATPKGSPKPKDEAEPGAPDLEELRQSGWTILLIPPCHIQRQTSVDILISERKAAALLDGNGLYQVVNVGISFDHGYDEFESAAEAIVAALEATE